MSSFPPLRSELGQLLRPQLGPSAFFCKHSQWTFIEVPIDDLKEGGLFAEKEFDDDSRSSLAVELLRALRQQNPTCLPSNQLLSTCLEMQETHAAGL